MKKSFLTSVSGFLVAGIVSANAGFAAETAVELNTKNENTQEISKKAAENVAEIDTKNENTQEISKKDNDPFKDEFFSESMIRALVNKDQKTKELFNENLDKKTKKNNAKENLTNSKKNENLDKKSKKDSTKKDLPKFSEEENSNKNKEGFFSIFKSLKSIKAGFAGILAFAGFSATSIALTAETVGLSKIGTKLGIEEGTANYITVGTGAAAAVLVTAEFLLKS